MSHMSKLSQNDTNAALELLTNPHRPWPRPRDSNRTRTWTEPTNLSPRRRRHQRFVCLAESCQPQKHEPGPKLKARDAHFVEISQLKRHKNLRKELTGI